MSKPPPGYLFVVTPKGRYVHAITDTGEPFVPGPRRYWGPVCNQVPRWHPFDLVGDTDTRPMCPK